MNLNKLLNLRWNSGFLLVYESDDGLSERILCIQLTAEKDEGEKSQNLKR